MSYHKYIRLKSGKRFYFSRPSISQFTLADCVWGNSRTSRFGGHTEGRPYTVTQHLCHCYDIAPPEVKPECLGHDLHEGIYHDVNSVLKALCPDYRDLESGGEKLVARKFKLRYPFPADVKKVDLIMLATEMKCLSNRKDYRDLPYPPHPMTITVWSEAKARAEFMKRWRACHKSS